MCWVLKALIVDDEYAARAELRHLLSAYSGQVEVVGEATHAAEALALLRAISYQLIFLDVDMPGLSGMDLAHELQQMPQAPHVIFVTAYDQFALEAFNVNAVDYLLKPFDAKRLHQALTKVLHDGPQRTIEAPARGAGPVPTRIDLVVAERAGKTALVPERDILFARAEGDLVYLHLGKERLLTRQTLKELAEKLRQPPFFRTHRSYLVNLRHVRELFPYLNGTYGLVLDDPPRTEIPVSRGQAPKLKALLGM